MKKAKLNRLGSDFFDQSCEELAQNMLGKILCRRLSNGNILSGYIVETESYLGGCDRASNSFNGRRTAHNEPVYMKAGTSFVYMTYGMYHCINISSREDGAAVLIRALEPISGVEVMEKLRIEGRKKRHLKIMELCNGPSKLCISLDITKGNSNKIDLSTSKDLWLEYPNNDSNFTQMMIEAKIIKCARIGIDSAGKEWASKPLRFYIKDNQCVSKRDKEMESLADLSEK